MESVHQKTARETFEEAGVGIFESITDKDGKEWEILHHYYPKNLERLGLELGGNCLHDVHHRTPGKRYLAASRIPEKSDAPRAAIEIYSIRPKTASGDTSSVLTFSYAPAHAAILEVEAGQRNKWEKSFLKSTDTVADAFMQFVTAAARGDIPEMPLKNLFNMGRWFDNREGMLLDNKGTIHTLSAELRKPPEERLDPKEYIAGSIVRVHPHSHTPEKIAHIAESYPATIHMTFATPEQKAALRTVRGSLIDESGGANGTYTQLTAIGSRGFFRRGAHFYFPNLTSVCQLLFVQDVTTFEAPLLESFFFAQVHTDTTFLIPATKDPAHYKKFLRFHVERFSISKPFSPRDYNL